MFVSTSIPNSIGDKVESLMKKEKTRRTKPLLKQTGQYQELSV